jgi:iron complex outermembrane receptor protein
VDRELFVPARPPFLFAGGPNFASEVSKVYELGYRAQATQQLSYSVTAFYHDHDRLRSQEPRIGATFENRVEGSTKGVEAWASWRPLNYWRLEAGWVELRQKLGAEPGSLSTTAGLGNDPRRWVKLRSVLDLTSRHELDVMVRHIAKLPNPEVPSYVAVDARLGWHVSKALDLSLLAQNLFDPAHPEWGAPTNRAEYRRGLFFQAVWRP